MSDRGFKVAGWTCFVLFFVFLLGFIILMGNAQAEESNIAYVMGDHVRLRSLPSTDGDIVGHCDKGDQVEVVVIEDGWALLTNGYYISAQFLTQEDPLEGVVYVLGPGVRERSSADTSSDSNVVCKHQAGEAIQVYGDPVDGWYRLKNGNYISADLVSPNYNDIYTHCAEQYKDIVIVSITKQEARFYHYNMLYVDDVVTGHATKSPTPTGLTKITRKICGVYLNGNKDTYVEYGCYFRDGFLIHDAESFPWRKTGFGGDIYKTNGSNGCVNTRTSFSEIVYRYSTVDVTYVLILP